MKKVVIGVLVVALVLGMQMTAFAQTSLGESAVDEVIDITQTEQQDESLPEDQAEEEEDELSGDESAPQTVTGGNFDENPETGVDHTMLKASGILLAISIAGIALTTRMGKKRV